MSYFSYGSLPNIHLELLFYSQKSTLGFFVVNQNDRTKLQPNLTAMSNEKILITGANGQIGSVLSQQLRKRYGTNNVLATDIRTPQHQDGPFEILNVMDQQRWLEIIKQHKITQIYHLVAILSASGEKKPHKTWDLNITSLLTVLELAKTYQLKVFFPSSIAVFGNDAPKISTPQDSLLVPTTVYGMSKVAGENWCNYYHKKFGVDVRSVRYPGIIGYEGLPGGGTTDYAVDIYHKAIDGEDFTCFLKPDSSLPMIYMPDAIKATIDLMNAPADQIKIRTSYNLSGMSFSPAEITTELQKHFPAFRVDYEPDFRQAIADSWPASIDDSPARTDWGWQEKYDLSSMTTDMILNLKKKEEAELY